MDKNNAEDFEHLFETYYMQVYSFLMTLAKNQDIAEEITQKTFFKVTTSKEKFKGKSSQFTYLCTIAKNLYIDELRKHKPLCELDIERIGGKDPVYSLVNEDSAFMIHQILHHLEEPYKEVFQLRVFGELSFKKIGMLFKKSENWARVTYYRARIKIQEKMEECK